MSQGPDVLVSRLRCTGEISFIADVFGSESQGPLGRAELTPPQPSPWLPHPRRRTSEEILTPHPAGAGRILLALGLLLLPVPGRVLCMATEPHPTGSIQLGATARSRDPLHHGRICSLLGHERVCGQRGFLAGKPPRPLPRPHGPCCANPLCRGQGSRSAWGELGRPHQCPWPSSWGACLVHCGLFAEWTHPRAREASCEPRPLGTRGTSAGSGGVHREEVGGPRWTGRGLLRVLLGTCLGSPACLLCCPPCWCLAPGTHFVSGLHHREPQASVPPCLRGRRTPCPCPLTLLLGERTGVCRGRLPSAGWVAGWVMEHRFQTHASPGSVLGGGPRVHPRWSGAPSSLTLLSGELWLEHGLSWGPREELNPLSFTLMVLRGWCLEAGPQGEIR